MDVLLHAGIDKAGSTAIQAHLHANRSWLAERGICIPNTGLTRFGHRKLFLPNRDFATWQRLGEELVGAAGAGYQIAILSFEGLSSLAKLEIQRMVNDLDSHQISALFYLRDQAEVLQSGYLQNLKASPQEFTIDNLRSDPGRLLLKSRDYYRMLAPFTAVLGKTGIRLLPFSRQLLVGGNVVDDFLHQLGITPDAGFKRLSMQQNPSLDIPSALYLNEIDKQGSIDNRNALVDDLLWIVRRDGPQERWFLDRDAVTMLRESYRTSNERLAEQFALPLNTDDFFGLSSKPWRDRAEDDGHKLKGALESLHHWHRWRGKTYSGAQLAPLLNGGDWLYDSQTWTCGKKGFIRFRVGLSRYAQQPRNLSLHIRGGYLNRHNASEVCVNGRSIGRLDLTNAKIEVGAPQLGPERDLTVELIHPEKEGENAQLFRLDQLELIRT